MQPSFLQTSWSVSLQFTNGLKFLHCRWERVGYLHGISHQQRAEVSQCEWLMEPQPWDGYAVPSSHWASGRGARFSCVMVDRTRLLISIFWRPKPTKLCRLQSPCRRYFMNFSPDSRQKNLCPYTIRCSSWLQYLPEHAPTDACLNMQWDAMEVNVHLMVQLCHDIVVYQQFLNPRR